MCHVMPTPVNLNDTITLPLVRALYFLPKHLNQPQEVPSETEMSAGNPNSDSSSRYEQQEGVLQHSIVFVLTAGGERHPSAAGLRACPQRRWAECVLQPLRASVRRGRVFRG